MRTYFKTKAKAIRWGKKYWGTGLVSEKYGGTTLVSEKNRIFAYAELNETVEAATSSYSATDEFLRYFYSVLVARCLVHKFSLTDIFKIPFYMTVASYCHYEKVRGTMRPAIVSYLSKYFYSFSVAELNNTESQGEVFV